MELRTHRTGAKIKMKLPALVYSVQKHWLAVLCAAIIGLGIVAPVIIFQFDESYRGVEFFGTDGELNYVAQVNAIYKGNYAFGNVFLYEGQDEPYIRQPLPAIITAALGKILFLDVTQAIIAAKV